jgi:LPXTG-site transpeptidase (sortase) family protein
VTTGVAGLSVVRPDLDDRYPGIDEDHVETGLSGGLLIRRVVGAVVTATGLLLLLLVLFLYAFTPLAAGRDQHRLLAALTGESRTTARSTFALTNGIVPPEGSPVAVLRIPTLGLTQAVVAGTSAADLEKGPGLMPGTVLPGEQGNAVIAGRKTTFGGPFHSIGTLRPGNKISVTDGLGSFRYRVTSVHTVVTGQRVVGGTSDNRLTLITSNSSFSTTGLVVTDAILVGKPAPSPIPLSHAIPSGEQGLSGQSGAPWRILVWFFMFLLAAAVTGWALRRWRQPWQTYLLAAPVLLACGLFTVQAVALALPATL